MVIRTFSTKFGAAWLLSLFLAQSIFAQTSLDKDQSLRQAATEHAEAVRLLEGGSFDPGIKLANSALHLRERNLGPEHTDTVATILVLVRLYTGKNSMAEAESLVERARQAAAKSSGTDSLDYAEVLYGLGRFRFFQGNHLESEKAYRQSLAIRERLAGPSSAEVGTTLDGLARLQRAMGEYPKAEENFTKALAIHEKVFGDHLETAHVLNNFGLFYYGKSDYPRAAALLERALALKEKVVGPNHYQTGIALNNLGLVAWKRRDYARAKAYYERALPIFEVANGPESDGVAAISTNLASIFRDGDKNLQKSEEYLKKALAIAEKKFGENSQPVASAVGGLAVIYRDLADYDRAIQFQRRAYAINRQVSGEYNLYTLIALGHLSRTYAAAGDAKNAAESMTRHSELNEKLIPLNLSVGSEKDKIAYYNQTSRFDAFISLHTDLARDDAAVRDLAATAVLRHKGRVLDAVSENLTALRRRLNPEDQKLLDSLNELNSKLSKTIVGGRPKDSPAEHERLVKALEDERDRLEAEIGRKSAGFYQVSKPLTLAEVKDAVPENAALIEFAAYHPMRWKDWGNPDRSPARYVVYMIRPSGEVQWKELGDAKTIDNAISAYRKALGDPKRDDVRALGRSLDQLIMQPVRAALGGNTRHLLISPDGDMNVIPFESLTDENGRYLIENFDVSYLTTGRDLLRMQRNRPARNDSLIVANPAFGAAADSSSVAEKQSVTATRSLTDTYFAPLSGTEQEARAIQKQFPDAVVLSGTDATEAALAKATPKILHIATHGFFLDNSGPENARNPLLRSGLALTGANRRGAATGEDGILTALEASGLNLWGTKLVVLSACETGLGDIKNGEGVYGLRRAFVLAGAESMVMSLWNVSDYTTRELMTRYYQNLKQGLGRGAALRRAQLELLKRKDRQHPFYWAAFIHAGEWGKLDGKR